MMNDHFMPPLRLVINHECNGKCFFCHREGNENVQDMSMKVLSECIEAVNKLHICQVSLTGGEPTLKEELPMMINEISDRCKNAKVCLTTNGYNLAAVTSKINSVINGINLSVISFDPHVAEQYQCVEPNEAFAGLEQFPADNKTVNVMITEDNYLEINRFKDFCAERGYNLDLMFLDMHDRDYVNIQKKVLDELAQMGRAQIILQSTSVMQIKISEKSHIRVKHPFLSKLLQRDICSECLKKEECFERVCAVRVYGDGSVSPCLSRHIRADATTRTFDRIEEIYKKLNHKEGFYDFLLSEQSLTAKINTLFC